jgi:hypothetical protein
MTDSWVSSVNDLCGLPRPDELRAKIVSALRRLQAVPNIVRAFFAQPDLYHINA